MYRFDTFSAAGAAGYHEAGVVVNSGTIKASATGGSFSYVVNVTGLMATRPDTPFLLMIILRLFRQEGPDLSLKELNMLLLLRQKTDQLLDENRDATNTA